MLTRRNIITGFTGILCAPAIIRVAGIMPIKMEKLQEYRMRFDLGDARAYSMDLELDICDQHGCSAVVDRYIENDRKIAIVAWMGAPGRMIQTQFQFVNVPPGIPS